MFPTYFVAHSRRAQRRSMQSMLPLLKLPPTGGNLRRKCPFLYPSALKNPRKFTSALRDIVHFRFAV